MRFMRERNFALIKVMDCVREFLNRDEPPRIFDQTPAAAGRRLFG